MTNQPLTPTNSGATPAPQNSPSAAPPRRWLALAVLALGLAMVVLDGTIVGVATPVIITALHLDLADAQWLSSLYNVVFAALLLPFGRLGDSWGRRRIFAIGTFIFVAGSILAAASGGAHLLLIARAVQGVGGAMVLPSTLSTVSATFRAGHERAMAFGIWGATMAGAAAIGPLLGGWFTTSFTWHWIFLVNVPLSVLVLAGTWFAVPETTIEASSSHSSSTVAGRPDVVGALTAMLGAGLVVFGLIEGRNFGWWAPINNFTVFAHHWPSWMPLSAPTCALVVGIAALAAFIVIESRRVQAGRPVTLNVTLFKVPTFAWGNLTAGMVAAGEFALVFVLPLYLVNALGLGTMGAGWVLAAMALGAFLSGGSARYLSAAMGATRVVLLGLGLELTGTLATLLLTRIDLSAGWLTGGLVIYGLGLGLASAQLTSTVLADVPVEQSGTASATQSTTRQLGSALGVALSGTVLGTKLTSATTTTLAALKLPTPMVNILVSATTASAGSNIGGVRAQGTHGSFGAQGPAVVHALSQGLAQATATTMWLTVGFLAVGLLGAGQVHRAWLHTRQSNTTRQ